MSNPIRLSPIVKAVIPRLPLDEKIAEAIADNPPVVDAAVAAIDAAMVGKSVIEGAPIVEDDIAFAVVDEDGRRTWIEAGMDGGLTDHAVSKIGEHITGATDLDTDITGLAFAVVDEDGRRTWLEADADGTPTQRAVDLIGAALIPALQQPKYPTDDWAHWGDSLTQLPSGNSVVDKMHLLTGKAHFNGGMGGQFTREIAARMGAVPTRVTVTGNAIPASGPVVLTSIVPNLITNRTAFPYTVRGSINDVTGTLAQTTDGTAVQFTRDTAGDVLAVAAGTLFVPENGDLYADRHVILWPGRNDVSYDTPVSSVVADIQQMIDTLTPRVRRVLIGEIVPSDSETVGTPDRVALDEFNAEIQATFSPYWAPVATWLRTSAAATAAGITFTANDTADIANGLTPRSLRLDNVHLNAAGATAAASFFYTTALDRGWI